MSDYNIKTLEGCTIAEITECFNESFREYFIPLQLTEGSMQEKIQAESIRLEYSAGAFAEGKLVGFILHGSDIINGIHTVYNAGTGVIPAWRGKGITAALYQFCFNLFEKENIHAHVLEVIEENTGAIKIYEQAGFTTVRNLIVYKGEPAIKNTDGIQFRDIDELPANEDFSSMQPAWQNANASIERCRERHQITGAFINDELLGYAVFIPATGRLNQLAVHRDHRRKGIGKKMLSYIAAACQGKPLTITHIDESYKPAISFLENNGFNRILALREMTCTRP